MYINYLLVVVTSFLLGMFFLALFRKLVSKYGFLTFRGVPLVGGASIGLSFVLTCLVGFSFYRGFSREIIGLLFASFIMLAFGIIDDRRELSIRAKFLAQFIATSVLIFFCIRTQIVYVGYLLNMVITFIWVIGITNAFNHLDVMDGISGGVAAVASLSFFIISILHHDIKVALLSLGLLGAVSSFLIQNLPPAKIYMGNSGSHLLGFILAAVALVISYAPLERKIALLSPLLILGFAIFDTTFLILVRMKKGRSAFKKSDDHLALRFLRLGYSKNKVLLFMLFLSLFFSLSGVMLSQATNFLGIIIICVVVLVSLTVSFWIEKATVDG